METAQHPGGAGFPTEDILYEVFSFLRDESSNQTELSEFTHFSIKLITLQNSAVVEHPMQRGRPNYMFTSSPCSLRFPKELPGA